MLPGGLAAPLADPQRIAQLKHPVPQIDGGGVGGLVVGATPLLVGLVEGRAGEAGVGTGDETGVEHAAKDSDGAGGCW